MITKNSKIEIWLWEIFKKSITLRTLVFGMPLETYYLDRLLGNLNLGRLLWLQGTPKIEIWLRWR